MLTVTCYDCGEMYSLRGWIEKEDLRGTQFEEKMDRITDTELNELEEKALSVTKWINLKRTLAVNIAVQKMLLGCERHRRKSTGGN